MAEHAHTPSRRPDHATGSGTARRSLLAGIAGTAALLAAGHVVTQDNPDAELLRLCAAFHHAHRSSYGAGDDPSWEAWLDRRYEISDQIEELTPVTDAGRFALAGVALVLIKEAQPENPSDYERLAHQALSAIVGGAA